MEEVRLWKDSTESECADSEMDFVACRCRIRLATDSFNITFRRSDCIANGNVPNETCIYHILSSRCCESRCG